MRVNYNARACDGERKAAGARTMASNGKNNAQNNGNSAQRSDVRLRRPSRVVPRGREKPAASRGGRHSQKSETRISAIADFARKGKREKKAFQLSLPTGRRDDDFRAPEEILLTLASSS
jgi:hypothetical protein